jgi:hypothetical protein
MSNKNPIAVALRPENTGSYRAAVLAKCYECMGGEVADPFTKQSVIAQIRACTAPQCPLYRLRGRAAS